MAKQKSQFVCQSCGAVFQRWSGRCDACGAWNSLAEETTAEKKAPGGLGSARGGGKTLELTGLTGATALPERYRTGIAELDRVCGGGLVPGAAILIGGDPGIGKSTLMLQAAARLSQDRRVIYVSGEEAVDQIRLRAQRLGLASAPVALAGATSVRDITATIDSAARPDIVVIDSIQTMYVDTLDSAPGSVGQVRASAHELIRAAKKHDVVVLLVGHVTKEGALAGPRVLEHMVDTVLYFEGERGHAFRILRAVKNRFGATDEIGVFEMADKGLAEVANPSALFLSDRRDGVPGTCVYAGIEGTRPVLLEIQALVAPSAYGTPRRAVVGWDSNRLAMILAVLETRCGLVFHQDDIYLNVAGGLKIGEPAADLAVAAALISALKDRALPPGLVLFGEIGLTGEVRAAPRMEARLKEAQKLGFHHAWTLQSKATRAHSGSIGSGIGGSIEVTRIADVGALIDEIDTAVLRAANG